MIKNLQKILMFLVLLGGVSCDKYTSTSFILNDIITQNGMNKKQELLDLEKNNNLSNKDSHKLNLQLSKISYQQEDYDNSLSYALKALSFAEKKSIEEIDINVFLAKIMKKKMIFSKAERYLNKAINISSKVYGKKHPYTAIILGDLAELYSKKSSFAKAKKIYKKSAIIINSAYGKNNSDVIKMYIGIANMYMKKGDIADALYNIRKADNYFFDYFNLYHFEKSRLVGKYLYDSYFLILARALEEAPRNKMKYSQEAFKVMQKANILDVKNDFGEHFAKKRNYLGSILRKEETIIEEYKHLEKKLFAQVMQKEEFRDRKKESSFRKMMRDIQAQKKRLDNTIKSKFPRYYKLIAPCEHSIYNIQKLIKKNEAIVNYYVAEKELYIFVASNKKMYFLRRFISKKNLLNKISKFRKQFEINGAIPTFDLNVSYDLYQEIFQPIEKYLKNKKDIIIVPPKEIENIAFNALIYKKGEKKLKEASWLFNKYNISILPLICDIKEARFNLLKKHVYDKYIIFSDPILNRKISRDNPANNMFSLMNVFSKSYNWFENLQFDKPILKKSYSKELATEKNIKELDFQNYDVVVLSTYASVPNKALNIKTPLFLFTPPRDFQKNDGFLKMSEIALIDFKSKFLMLPFMDRTLSSVEQKYSYLSSLSRGFFYANANEILVSNWLAPKVSSLEIMKKFILKLRENPNTKKSVLLRQAQLEYKNQNKEIYSHPLFWASFSIIGL